MGWAVGGIAAHGSGMVGGGKGILSALPNPQRLLLDRGPRPALLEEIRNRARERGASSPRALAQPRLVRLRGRREARAAASSASSGKGESGEGDAEWRRVWRRSERERVELARRGLGSGGVR
ncbi:hypothetical protein AcW1_005089 [Taiwanofungus camphoratus]|nr:hypothetical protein AcW1_005089 [Antrodia cinnamomea]